MRPLWLLTDPATQHFFLHKGKALTHWDGDTPGRFLSGWMESTSCLFQPLTFPNLVYVTFRGTKCARELSNAPVMRGPPLQLEAMACPRAATAWLMNAIVALSFSLLGCNQGRKGGNATQSETQLSGRNAPLAKRIISKPGAALGTGSGADTGEVRECTETGVDLIVVGKLLNHRTPMVRCGVLSVTGVAKYHVLEVVCGQLSSSEVLVQISCPADTWQPYDTARLRLRIRSDPGGDDLNSRGEFNAAGIPWFQMVGIGEAR